MQHLTSITSIFTKTSPPEKQLEPLMPAIGKIDFTGQRERML